MTSTSRHGQDRHYVRQRKSGPVFVCIKAVVPKSIVVVVRLISLDVNPVWVAVVLNEIGKSSEASTGVPMGELVLPKDELIRPV